MPSDPHHNPQLERSLLSCCLFGTNEVLAAARDGLIAEAFHNPSHRKLWNALTICATEDHSTEVSVVWRRLAGLTGDGIPVTALELSDLYATEPTTARFKALLSDVLGLWRQRRLVAALNAALDQGTANAGHWEDVWEVTEPHLRRAMEVANANASRTLADVAEIAANRIEHGDTRPTIETGIPVWDREAGCPRAGELIVLAGRPGTGKTALALQATLCNVKKHGNVAFFTMEMATDELIERMAAQLAGTPGIWEPKKRAPHARAVGAMTNLHVYEGRDSSNIAQIEARSRLLAAHPSGLRLIVVDYLQLVAAPPETRQQSRERQVAELSRRFKLLALDLQCPILLLAQLNRESEREQRRPRMSDLRESGAIEQDADRVWFLYQETKDTDSPTPEDAAEISVRLYQAKCRNGTPGIVAPLKFNRPIFTFTK